MVTGRWHKLRTCTFERNPGLARRGRPSLAGVLRKRRRAAPHWVVMRGPIACPKAMPPPKPCLPRPVRGSLRDLNVHVTPGSIPHGPGSAQECWALRPHSSSYTSFSWPGLSQDPFQVQGSGLCTPPALARSSPACQDSFLMGPFPALPYPRLPARLGSPGPDCGQDVAALQ